MTAQILRSRRLAGVVHAGLWLLLLLSLSGLRDSRPPFRDRESLAPPIQVPVVIARLDRLFQADSWPDATIRTNAESAFHTRHFIPPVAPAPPPPTTKKVELTYQGFYTTEGGVKRVLVRMGDAFLVAAEGTALTANLFASQATVMSLALTNSTGQTNVLTLNKKQAVEVPIK